MDKVITIAVAGYGLRGQCYSQYTLEHPESMKVVAVADIVREKVDAAKELFHLPEEMCFDSAEEMLKQPKLADLMFVCTQDRQHVPMALEALERGYHVMTEKPISPDVSECLKLQQKSHETGKVVTVCHVLRYSPFYQKVKEIMQSGRLGEIQNISANEDVGYFHQAHSFVRGNWRSSEETSPMILAKSCHDMDLFQWLMADRCKYISSYGSLSHFRADKAPEGATEYCLGGCKCKETCPYDAEKIYITNKRTGVRENNGAWPCDALCLNPTEENLYEALKTGPYGRCVYHCDNDVVDHEVVNMEFENGATASFTMTGFTKEIRRTIRVMGTLGELEGNAETGKITVRIFGSEEDETIDVSAVLAGHVGHAGGDTRLVDNIIGILQKGDLENNLTSIDASVHSHVMALAAEESRLENGKSILIREFEQRMQSKDNCAK